jgi:hypothetical protein
MGLSDGTTRCQPWRLQSREPNDYIGHSQFSWDPTLDGNIDEFRVYNRALPTIRSGSVTVTITSDNRAVASDGSVLLVGGLSRSTVTVSVPGVAGTTTLTASAAGLTPATSSFAVVP